MLIFMAQTNMPDYVAKTVKEYETKDGEKKEQWTDIGIMYYNQKSDTFTCYLGAAPLGDKIIFIRPRDPEPKEDDKHPFKR
jgi:hypothetical protein